MRSVLPIALNVLLPGAGLILLRRERCGVAVAFLFSAAAQLMLWGTLLIPATVPGSITLWAAATSGAIWLVAQGLLWSGLRAVRDANLPAEKAMLIQLASEAMNDGIYLNARLALESALTLDDEDLVVNLLWARLLTTTGRFGEARGAWRRVEQLDRTSRHRREVTAALQQLPPET
jgi:hypothetical protein